MASKKNLTGPTADFAAHMQEALYSATLVGMRARVSAAAEALGLPAPPERSTVLLLISSPEPDETSPTR